MVKTKISTDAGKYKLGGEAFKNWEEVHFRAKQILSKGSRKLRGKNFKFIFDLLSYHPFYEKKTKDGVKGIKVGNPTFGYGLCFIIIDNKGNEQDFSYKKCTPTGANNREKAIKSVQTKLRLKCYREAIQDQIIDFSISRIKKGMKCPGCKLKFEDIKKNNDIQIDHKTKSFVTLVTEFEELYKPSEYPPIERTKSTQTAKFNTGNPEHKELVSNWQNYHKKNADLQFLCLGCNCRKQDGSRYKPYIK